MKILTITARRWEGAYEGGWELYDRDHILTQVTRLGPVRKLLTVCLCGCCPGRLV